VASEESGLDLDEVARILGMSRALVAHRMDRGHLPFHYVGDDRRAKLKDVLAFKKMVDAQQAIMEALADDAEDLRQRYGV
jgi:hypothetical protein